MEFRIGLSVKPKEINEFGEVIFINSAEVTPAAYTEADCLAYGFKYAESTCFVITNGVDFFSTDDTNVNDFGSRNQVQSEVFNSNIIGKDNSLLQNSNNNIIVGDSNTISGISNTILSGTKGDALYNNSQVLGGNQYDDLETRQSIVLLAGLESTTASWGNAKLSNDGSTRFTIEDNSIVTYNIYITGVRTGGTAAGNKGDFKTWVERGSVVNRAGTSTLKRVRTNVGNDGTTTGWNVTSAVNVDNYLNISLKGATNMNIKWIAKLELIELKTGIDLS